MSSAEPVSKKQRYHLQTETFNDRGQVEEKKMSHQLIRLDQICIGFIAENLHLVDSFVGFPDIISFKIFQSADSLKKFSSASKDSLHGMELFCDAYGDSVMSCLSLRSCHLGIADYLDHLCLFSHLSELDIGGCGLGDDHELLQHISSCHSLTKLGLSDNALTDTGIQKLTTPLRMFHRGPEHLTFLDLSGNTDITYAVSRFLKFFKQLMKLNLTGTAIKAKYVKAVEEKLSMKCDLCPKDECLTENQGWAADIVHKWMTQGYQKMKAVKTKSETSKFYQRTSVINQILAEKTNKRPRNSEQTEVVFLVKRISDISNSQIPSTSNQTWQVKSGQKKIKMDRKCFAQRTSIQFDTENSTPDHFRVKLDKKQIQMDGDLVTTVPSNGAKKNVTACDSTIWNLYSSGASKSEVNSKSLSSFMDGW